jgi:ABC-type phosphate/phosphonate transport system substrate-binding protein
MKIKRFVLAFLLLSISMILLGRWQNSSLAQPINTYHVGVMTKSYDEKRAKALEKFEEIIGKYIEERAGMKIRLKALTYPDLIKAIEKESVDIIWGYGLVVSMELSQKFPIVPIVAPTLGEERRTLFKRFVISTKDSVHRMADLKGKRLTYVGDEQWSFELLVFKVWAAEKFGLKDITQYFSLKGREPDEGFFIPASKRGGIYSLIIKEADVAVAHEFEYITQEKLTPYAVRERIEILPFFNPLEGFMEAPVFVRRGLDKKDIEKLMKVVMEMSNDPEGKQILLSSKISSFVKVTDQDYQPVKALITKKEGLGIK